MGSGLSDMNTMSADMLHAEIIKEFSRIKIEHLYAVQNGAVSSAKLDDVKLSFETLSNAYHQYEEIYNSGSRSEQELIEDAIHVNDLYRSYRQLKSLYIFQIGDIVKVRDDEIPGLFVEAVVYGIKEKVIEIKVTEDARSGETSEAYWREVSVDNDEVRKVKSWDCLEAGDRVRVKDGNLFFQGIVIGVSDDEEEVTVDFSDHQDEHEVENDYDDDEEEKLSVEEEVRVVHRQFVEKIDTSRIIRPRLKEYAQRVQKSIVVTKAFKESLFAGLKPNHYDSAEE